MKLFWLSIASLLLAIGPAVQARPQNSTQDDNAKHNRSAKVRKLTGCIGRGATDREYTIDSADGSSWDIKSDAVDLAPHVGHTVTVTGAVDHAKLHAAKEKGKTVKDNSAPEHGHLTVTNLKMISKGCSH